MKVKPVDPNAVIRDPHTKRVLPAEGGDVPDNSFWNRRLIAGEVVHVDEPAKSDRPTKDRQLVEPTVDPIAPLTTREGK